MYDYELRKSVERVFLRIAKKDKKQLLNIKKKIHEIIKNPHRYKNLRKPLQHLKRVHIDKSFVLVFSINESTKTLIFEDYDHHDNIYKTGKPQI